MSCIGVSSHTAKLAKQVGCALAEKVELLCTSERDVHAKTSINTQPFFTYYTLYTFEKLASGAKSSRFECLQLLLESYLHPTKTLLHELAGQKAPVVSIGSGLKRQLYPHESILKHKRPLDCDFAECLYNDIDGLDLRESNE